MRIADAYEQLPIGKLYDKRTVDTQGAIPVVDQSADGVLGYHDNEPGVFATAEDPVVTFANHTCAMRLIEHPFSVIQNVFPMVGKPGVCDTVFFYYATDRRQRIEDYKGHHPAWRNSFFAAPDLATQRKIAGVLYSFDALIANNRRRIELLEQMADAIYREWFVRFRYPGHESATFVDSPLGRVPNGWTVRPLSELADLVRGRSYRKHELSDSAGIPFVNLKCMARGGGFRVDGLKRYTGAYVHAQRVRHGDVVLAVTDLTHERAILAQATLIPRLDEPYGVISLDVARLVPRNEEDRLAIFFALRCSDFADRVKELANGSTVLHLSPTHVAQAAVLWPDIALRRRFVTLAEPMVAMQDELTVANRRLQSIRDALLPRLVSGRIDVSHLDLDELVGSVE